MTVYIFEDLDLKISKLNILFKASEIECSSISKHHYVI